MPPKRSQRPGSEDSGSDEDPSVSVIHVPVHCTPAMHSGNMTCPERKAAASPRTSMLLAADDPADKTTKTLESTKLKKLDAAALHDCTTIVSQCGDQCGGFSAAGPRPRSGQHDATNAPQHDLASVSSYHNVDAHQHDSMDQRKELKVDSLFMEIDFDAINPDLQAARANNPSLPNPYVPERGRGRSLSGMAARRDHQTVNTRPCSSASGRCLGTGRCLNGCVEALVGLAACSSLDEANADNDGGGWSTRGGRGPIGGSGPSLDAGGDLAENDGLDAGGGLGSDGGLRARNRSAQDDAPLDGTLGEPVSSERSRPRSAPQPPPNRPQGN